MNKHRYAIERLYKGKCDIYEYSKEKGSNGRTTSEERLIHESIPCRLSHSSIPATNQTEGGKVAEGIKLFIAPELSIKPNSKIVVKQNGVTRTFKNSSLSAIYTDHQEINLEIFDRWA